MLGIDLGDDRLSFVGDTLHHRHAGGFDLLTVVGGLLLKRLPLSAKA